MGVYRERPSAIAGAVVWTAVAESTTSRVLPDGCIDLLWDGTAVRIAGPDTTAHLHTTTLGATLTGLRFAPGAAPGVLGVPADELTDRQVPLDEVWPRRAAVELAERLAAGASLEGEVLGLAGAAAGPSASTRHMTARLRAGTAVDALAGELGVTRRQLHRRCLAAYGYGPKRLARILRLQDALSLAHTGRSLADVAARAGYADQAHLSRDARDLAGVPVGQLV